MRRRESTFLLQTQPGFEAIAAQELAARLEGAALAGTRRAGDHCGMALFTYGGDPQDLEALRTAEDLFALVAHVRDLPADRRALKELQAAAVRSSDVESVLELAADIHPARRRRGPAHFRVIARQVGPAPYRRQEAQEAVALGIASRRDHDWRLSSERGLEFWLTLWPGEAILAVRLSDSRMRHREYKVAHLPASLRPSAAAALVWLTRPKDDDLFLDPMCGAGTILIERAHAGRYRLLLGGDLRAEAVAAARENVGRRYQPIKLEQWDATRLPVDAGTVTACAVNLPFGLQMGSAAENRALYPAFLREMRRVMAKGARLAALTGDSTALTDSLLGTRKMSSLESYRVRLLGRAATVFVVERT
jgi:23S rRNA G2445 N2-methylase RlmL